MSKEMRKYIDTFKQRLTESEKLNISDVSRSSYLESIMKKMSLSTFTDDVKVEKGYYYYILSNDYIKNGDYIYDLKADSVSELDNKEGRMAYMAYANTYTTKRIKYSNNPNMNFD